MTITAAAESDEQTKQNETRTYRARTPVLYQLSMDYQPQRSEELSASQIIRLTLVRMELLQDLNN